MHLGRVMLIGSANMDLVVRTPRFPVAGETVLGTAFDSYPGGKGANQAAACGKLGGKPRFVAKVGNDPFGHELLHSLQRCGVDTGSVVMDPSLVTGVASITVAENGQNTIVVAPGANSFLHPDDATDAIAEIDPGVMVCQLEIPLETVVAAAAALPTGKIFILNPAPARDLPSELLRRVDYLTPNESETESLTGIYPRDDDSCQAAAEVLFKRGVRNVVFTLGAAGSYLATPQFGQSFPTLAVRAVDTTAAGDAFNGALAHFLAQGYPIDHAVLLANIAGALSTTKRGAQASMPTLREVAAEAAGILSKPYDFPFA